VLRGESYGVQELTSAFDMIQSRMSHHLKVLATAGLVATRREGTFIFYRRPLIAAEDPHRATLENLFQSIDQLEIPEELQTRLAVVREERDRQSQQFFDRHANRFQERQNQIVTFSQYEASLDELLGALALPESATVLEVGPGTGELLVKLHERYTGVHALDSSEEMLARTRAAMEQRGLTGIHYHFGTLERAEELGLCPQLIVLNMVLHHMASPAAAFKRCAAFLAVGGSLLVADLNPHTQSWVRELCGDLWLGFEREDLTNWAAEAGLTEGQSVYLGLKNGFGVQMRLFKKK
jgi:ubiquinone/menaquinone biosynthesis C-methylase UbiE